MRSRDVRVSTCVVGAILQLAGSVYVGAVLRADGHAARIGVDGIELEALGEPGHEVTNLRDRAVDKAVQKGAVIEGARAVVLVEVVAFHRSGVGGDIIERFTPRVVQGGLN